MPWRRPGAERRRRIVLIALLGAVSASALAQIASTPQAYLHRLDADTDGRIGLAEFQDYMSRGFRDMDRNGDGILAADELPIPGARPRHLVDLLADLAQQFARLDRNGDGYLDPAELTSPPR